MELFDIIIVNFIKNENKVVGLWDSAFKCGVTFGIPL